MKQKHYSRSESPRSFVSAGTVGAIVVAAVGGYLIWRNREKIQELLADAGIPTEWMNGSVKDKLPPNLAKTSSAMKSDGKRPDSVLSAAV